MTRPSHYDEDGHARMVDVGGKDVTVREAVASARLVMGTEAAAAVAEGTLPKGDALAVARVAAIMAAKRTPETIPLCHSVALSSVDVALDVDVDAGVADITVTARTADRTGVEMEALNAAAVAALTLYDMTKSIARGAVISHIRLEAKRGGRSGEWVRR